MPIRNRHPSRAAAVVLAGGVVAAAIGFFAPAYADDGSLLIDLPGDGQGFVHDTSVPMLAGDRLAPGFSTSGSLTLYNDSAHTASLNMRISDVVEAENGCLRQELNAGDTTCTADGGELGPWLAVTVSQTGGPHQQLWSGRFGDLLGGVTLGRTLAPGEKLPLQLTVELLPAAGNDTMTDTVRFTLRFTASSDDGVQGITSPPQSAGTPGGQTSGGSTHAVGSGVESSSHAQAGQPQLSTTGPLPGTGSDVNPLLLEASVLLVLLGGRLALAGRRTS